MLPAIPFALTEVVARDVLVAGCAADARQPAAAYAARAFSYRSLRLRDGTAVTAAVAQTPCLAANQSTRVWIYRKAPTGYVRVLDEFAIPNGIDVRGDGIAVLSTHETMETMLEKTYVWNGTQYVFAPERSHVYDVAIGERRPYVTPMPYASGASGATLRGTVALNFGDTYGFHARAGQRVTLEVVDFRGKALLVALSDGERTIAILRGRRWEGTLPYGGSYYLDVYGDDESDATRTSTYVLHVEIR